MKLQLLSVAFFLIAKEISACCIKGPLQGTLGVVSGISSGGQNFVQSSAVPFYINSEGTKMVEYVNVTGPNPYHLRIIIDSSEKESMWYQIQDGKCTSFSLGHENIFCIPEFAKPVSRYTLGVAPDPVVSVTAYNYKFSLGKTEFNTTTSLTDNCTPYGSVQVSGLPGGGMLQILGYVNMRREPPKDPSIFDIPPECKKPQGDFVKHGHHLKLI